MLTRKLITFGATVVTGIMIGGLTVAALVDPAISVPAFLAGWALLGFHQKPTWANEVQEVSREEAAVLFHLGAEVFSAHSQVGDWSHKIGWYRLPDEDTTKKLPNWEDFYYIRKDDDGQA